MQCLEGLYFIRDREDPELTIRFTTGTIVRQVTDEIVLINFDRGTPRLFPVSVEEVLAYYLFEMEHERNEVVDSRIAYCHRHSLKVIVNDREYQTPSV